MIIFWTAGCIGTFALMAALKAPDRYVATIQVIDPTVPLWAIQWGIVLSCVFLWPVLLMAMILDWVKGGW